MPASSRSSRLPVNRPIVVMPPAECPAAAIRVVSIRPFSLSPAVLFSAIIWLITYDASAGWLAMSSGLRSATP